MTCRVEPRTTDNIGRRLAAVHKVLRSITLQTPTNSHFERELDTMRNIQPVKIGVKQICQAAVEVVSSADCPSCCIQHTLKTISSGLWRLSQHGVAAVNAGWDEGMYQCLCRLSVKQMTDSLNVTKPVLAWWTFVWNVLVNVDEIVTPRWRMWLLAVMVLSPSRSGGSLPTREAEPYLETSQRSSVFSPFSLSLGGKWTGKNRVFELFTENGKHWSCFAQL